MADERSKYNAISAPDLIKGWNEKRLSNNDVISGLTPFVQLIGIFNNTEYEKMLSGNTTLHKKQVYYVEDNVEEEVSLGSLDKDGDPRDLYEEMQSKLSKRYINIYSIDATSAGDADPALLITNAETGILMAEAVSQSENYKGGVGITDLQIDYGKQAALGARTFTMRLTINDPSLLNEKPEYSKLATQFGEFMLLYGWSNPGLVPGYDATPPPQLEPDPNNETFTDENGIVKQRQRMVIPLTNMDSGGYWSASKVNISKYDFAFNDVGQLEITVVFRDMTTIYLTTTKVNTIVPMFKKLMSTADYDPRSAKPGFLAKTGIDFTKIMLAPGDTGSEPISIVDNFLNEQNALSQSNSTSVNSSLPYIPVVAGITDVGLSEMMSSLEGESSAYNTSNLDRTSLAQRKNNESGGFPLSIGIASYEKVETNVITYTESGEALDDVRDDYKVTTVYYYLGWVLEALRLSLSDANRSRLLQGDKVFNPQFFYLDNEDDSKLTSAFQSEIARRTRTNSMEERIQEAIIRLKENCLPPDPPVRPIAYIESEDRGTSIGSDKTQWKHVMDLVDKHADWLEVDTDDDGEMTFEREPSFLRKEVTPCYGIVVYEGYQTMEKRKWLIDNKVDRPNNEVGNYRLQAFRGHQMSLIEYGENALEEGAGTVGIRDAFGGDVSIFIPDWPDSHNDGVLSSQVFEDTGGYDPRNPGAYKIQDYIDENGDEQQGRGGMFFYKVSYFYKFGQYSDQLVEEEVVRIMEVDAYRKQDTELWESTQRYWNNIYKNYLKTYFESIIRLRISELQREGRRVEDIYDEPVDLDFLTGRVYRNLNFRNSKENTQIDSRKIPKELDENGAKKFLNQLKRDLRPKFADMRAEMAHLQGEKERLISETSGPYGLNKKITDTIDAINNIKKSIELFTGGTYYRQRGSDGILRLTRFRNLKGYKMKSLPDNYFPGEDPQRDIMEMYGPENEKPEISDVMRLVRGLGHPSTIRRITPSRMNIHRFAKGSEERGGTGEFFVDESALMYVLPDYEHETTSEDVGSIPAIGSPIETYDLSGILRAGSTTRYWSMTTQEQHDMSWPAENAAWLESQIELVAHLEGASNVRYQDAMKTIQQINLHIEKIDNRIKELEGEITNLNEFVDQNPADFKGFSIYDDTPDIDTIVNLSGWAGRDARLAPCLLNTKPAQYFKALLDSGHSAMRGVSDIENYGPAWGGTQYWYASNTKRFMYDPHRLNKDTFGISKVVLDPEELERNMGGNTIAYSLYMDKGAEGVGEISSSRTYTSAESIKNGALGSTKKIARIMGNPVDLDVWINWGMFGVPGKPFENGANMWGFKRGAKTYGDHVITDETTGVQTIISEGTMIVGGGDYVENYAQLLDIFNLKVNPDLSGPLRIVDRWAQPIEGVHLDELGNQIPYFYMIDEANNVVMPGKGDKLGQMVQTGYYLGSGETPVYLYPDRAHAVEVDPEKGPHDHGWIKSIGFSTDLDGTRKETPGNRNKWPRDWSNKLNCDVADEFKDTPGFRQYIDTSAPHHAALPASTRLRDNTDMNLKIRDAGEQKLSDFDDNETNGSFGPRLDRWEHNMNLTLDQKRSLVIPRGASRNDRHSNEKQYSLGKDDPTGHTAAGADDELIGGYSLRIDDDGDETKRAREGGYTNTHYPFGTGYYTKGGIEDYFYGSFVAPEIVPNMDYLYIGDFLTALPEGNGMRTKVNNKNGSETTIDQNGKIINGSELNIGVVQFIVQNVLAPLGHGRRIGSRTWGSHEKPQGPIAVRKHTNRKNKYKITDTTYRHLFSTEEEAEVVDPGPGFADLTNLKIDNAGDIPVRRDVVDNLMTKNNTNMSIAQFIQEVTRPGALGVNTGNINVGFRQRTDGVYEVFQANKNWRNAARKIYKDYDASLLTAAHRYPTDHLLFDYKANDSLIENIDMNSKFDPAVALTFKRGALDFAQDADIFAKFLAYGTLAPDLVQFLADQDNAADYDGVISVVSDVLPKVVIQKNAFKGENRIISESVVSAFLMQNPERLAKLNTFVQSHAGGNFTTQLMANYMRQSTITIHGLVNLIPFTSIHIRGVLPHLEGVYLVTSVRDSITPQGFNTVINAVLIEPLNAYGNDN